MTATTNPDVAVTIDVLSNDEDPDGDSLTVDSVTQPTNGSVLINADQTVTYSPATNFNGVDSFRYVVLDGQGVSATATVSVTVTNTTVLVANFMNGNTDFFKSRVHLWNPSTSAGAVRARVFTLPNVGDSLLLGEVDFEILQSESAVNIKLAEDILGPLGIPMPYMENAGNLTLEFTIEAPNVGGAGNVLPSEADVAMARRNKGYEHGLPSKKSLR